MIKIPSQEVLRILSSTLSEAIERNEEWRKDCHDESESEMCQKEADELDVAWHGLYNLINSIRDLADSFKNEKTLKNC